LGDIYALWQVVRATLVALVRVKRGQVALGRSEWHVIELFKWRGRESWQWRRSMVWRN